MKKNKFLTFGCIALINLMMLSCVAPQMGIKKQLSDASMLSKSDSLTVAYLPILPAYYGFKDSTQLDIVVQNDEIPNLWANSFKEKLPVNVLGPDEIVSIFEVQGKSFYLDDYLSSITNASATDIWAGGVKINAEDIPVDDTQILAEMLKSDLIVIQWIQGMKRFTSSWAIFFSRWDYYNSSTLVTLILDSEGKKVAEVHHSVFGGFSAIKPPFLFLSTKIANTFDSNTLNGVYSITDDNARMLALMLGQKAVSEKMARERADAPPIPTFMRYEDGNLWVSLGTEKQWKPQTCLVINNDGSVLYSFSSERIPANMYGTYMLKLLPEETQKFGTGDIHFVINTDMTDQKDYILAWH